MILLSAVNSLALLISLSILCVIFACGIIAMSVLIVKGKKKDRKIMEQDVYNGKNDSLNVDSENSVCNADCDSVSDIDINN